MSTFNLTLSFIHSQTDDPLVARKIVSSIINLILFGYFFVDNGKLYDKFSQKKGAMTPIMACFSL